MVSIYDDKDLRRMTTLGVPAVARSYAEASSIGDLDELRRRGFFAASPIYILGGGSNTFFTRDRLQHNVLHYTGAAVTAALQPDGSAIIRAEAGCRLDDLVNLTCSQSLWGLENLSLIPGDVGGATVQNVGAYGAEWADCLMTVETYDLATGRLQSHEAAALELGYRTSAFKTGAIGFPALVTAVTLQLSSAPRPRLGYAALARRVEGRSLTPLLMREVVTAMRREKLPDPAVTGSVGSYFVNPVVSPDVAARILSDHPDAPAYAAGDKVKLSAAWLIDHAGCKHMRIGGAALWPAQPLVLVNATGNATADDLLSLEHSIRDRVHERFGVTLRCEVVKVD